MDFSTASKTSASTPSSSPGLFSPTTTVNPHRIPLPPPSDGTPQSSPYLHPLQMHKVRETHKAQVEQDFITGRKLINQYEVIEEIGRGVHGKVKLARSLETGENVAIKIIQRFSKKRRLGRVTVSPEDKTKREIAILKKVRHPNVVGLLEVIDDPELKKIYMVLEHVELGEITWRKKGAPQICLYERRRVEMERRGLEKDITGNDEKYFKMMERRRHLKESKRAGLSQQQVQGPVDHWSLEHGDDYEGNSDAVSLAHQMTHGSTQALSRRLSVTGSDRGVGSFPPSKTPSRAPSPTSSRAHTPLPEYDIPPLDSDNEDDVAGPLPTIPSTHASLAALEGSYYGSYPDEPPNRMRSPSMDDSVISHMSSLDEFPRDTFEEDYSYVPWFTIDQARTAFRDTVLGLEYLHYEGIVHRDIKPANLLWTKDHRVKISDFGVSYFGRPIREGETEENISEADATDFDDDLELAKTVGTPAFFAPELCYTDLDMEQPKVTEQIDVWSLGVTLYCLIFARIPFLADDEYQLFRCIAKEDAYIPRRRLRAVDPSASASASQTSLNKRAGPVPAPYREDGELAYEEVDDELHDLLRRMLLKDPMDRLTLREVKRHPWVIRGMDNVIGWLDDTDPSRKTAGRRIQVDDRELERAVVPITFLERARSAVKKTINKVIGVTRSETRGESSRRRAISSATSSGTDNLHTPLTPVSREGRRSSLRGDEYTFGMTHDQHEIREPYEHPLAQSLTASPDLATYIGNPFERISAQHPALAGTPSEAPATSIDDIRPGAPDRSNSGAASIRTVIRRSHSHSKSASSAPFIGTVHDEAPTTSGPFTDHSGGIFDANMWQYRRGRETLAEIEEGTSSRARSVDRSLFESENKHSEPTVAMSGAVAPGTVEPTTVPTLRPSRSVEASPMSAAHDKPLPSPLFFEPAMIHAHQSSSTQISPHQTYALSNLDDQPSTVNETPGETTPPSRTFGARTPEPFPLVQGTLGQEPTDEGEEEEEEHKQKQGSDVEVVEEIQRVPATSVPDDKVFAPREEETRRAQSYDSVTSTSRASVTSPSDTTSPASSAHLGSQEQIFPSVPSLPALISGASSVSADTEGEFLQQPGVTYHTERVFTADSTPETLTPPSMSKQSTRESEAIPRTVRTEDQILMNTDVDEEGYNGDGDTTTAGVAEEDSDSDSDGLTMTSRKRHHKAKVSSDASAMPRRGTNASVCSTETAKKVIMDS